MPFKLTETQLAELQALRNTFLAPVVGNTLDYAVLYDKLLEYVYAYAEHTALTSAELETVLWIEGAITVNRDIGAQSTFIREYNNQQKILRYGESSGVSDAEMNQVSDVIVLQVIDEVLNGRIASADGIPETEAGELPSVDAIAQHDAQPAAVLLFNGEENPGGWAGNPLFLFLNHNDAYDNNILGIDGDTYNIFAMIKTTLEVSSGISNGWGIFSTDFRDLIFSALDTASQVDAMDKIFQARDETETFLQNTYGERLLFSEHLVGLSTNNIVVGTYGDDSGLQTSSNSDSVHGGTGNDVIFGSVGADLIDGGSGSDTIDYRTSGMSYVEVTIEDSFYPTIADYAGAVEKWRSSSSSGLDYLYNVENIIGTNQNDTFYIDVLKSINLDGAEGDDVLDFSNHGGGLTIDVNIGMAADIVFQNFYEFVGATDFVNLFKDGIGSHKYNGGTKSDIIDYSDLTGVGIHAVMVGTDGTVTVGSDTDTLVSIEIIEGTAQADTFEGGNGKVTFIGGDGGDTYIHNGHDIKILELDANTGNDILAVSGATPDSTTGKANERGILVTFDDGSGSFFIPDAIELVDSGAQAYAAEDFIDNEEPEEPTDEVKDIYGDFTDSQAYNYSSYSPLVLDLDDDGIELTEIYGTGSVYFDIDNDGFKEALGWVTGGDGLLALDQDGNGIIDDQSELFGNYYSYNQIPYGNGFTKLDDYDDNYDDIISSLDDVFADLVVWIDADGNGINTAGENHSLISLGITEISVDYNDTYDVIAGNEILQESTFVMNGNTQAIVDVWFAGDNVNGQYAGDFTLNETILLMPDIRGYGTLPDMQIAMSQNGTLLSMMSNYLDAGYMPQDIGSETQIAELRAVLHEWAGVLGHDTTNRFAVNTLGFVNDADVEFIETYFDESYAGGASIYNAGVDAVYKGLHTIMGVISAQLFFQSDISDFLFTQKPIYNSVTHSFSDNFVFDQAAFETRISDFAEDSIDRLNFVANTMKMFKVALGFDSLSPAELSALETTVSDSLAFWGDVTLEQASNFILLRGFNAQTEGGNELDDLIVARDGYDDTINANNGNDVLIGQGGNNTLNAGNGDDVLNGGAGDDGLYGGAGDDTYMFSMGTDIALDPDGYDVLRFGEGITLADLHVEKHDQGSSYLTTNNLVISDDFGNSIQFSRQFYFSYTQLEALVFDDGSTVLLMDIEIDSHGTDGNDTLNGIESGDLSTDDVMYGYGGDDKLYGKSGNDSLIGGTGDDILEGGAGNDIYEWSVGDGNDTIKENVYGEFGLDQIIAHGIVEEQVFLERVGTDLRVNLGSEYLTVYRHFYSDSSTYDYYEVESLLLDDGTLINLNGGLTITGTDSNDSSLQGTTGNDTLIGGLGDDSLYGKTGDDIYEWSVGDGNDAINETGGVDQIKLHGVSKEDIIFEHNTNSLRIHVNGEYIHVNNHFYADQYNNSNYLTYQVESVLLDDGTLFDLTGGMTFTALTAGQTVNGLYHQDDVLIGSSGNENLYGRGGLDILIGGLGSDRLDGGDDNDIADYSASNAAINVDLSTNTVSGGHAQGDTLVSIEGVIGSDYDDTITGSDGDNVLSGGAGNDTLSGGLGNDEYRYMSGNDMITETGGLDDTLHLDIPFPTEADPDRVKLVRYISSPDDLQIRVDLSAASNESDVGVITVADYFDASEAGLIERIVFNDAQDRTLDSFEVITFADGETANIDGVSIGGHQKDIIYGTGLAETINAGDGLDFVYGNGGGDTIHGGDSGDALFGWDGDDTIYGDAGDDFIFGDDNDTNAANTGVDTLHGGSGSDWIDGGNGNDTLYGGTEMDFLLGGAGNDILYGEAGDDHLMGGVGADTFVWLSGDLGSIDAVYDFNVSEGDVIDISDILTGYVEGTSDITEFVQISSANGTDSILSIDVNGGADDFVPIAVLYGTVGIDDVALLKSNGNLDAVV